jgi:predicted phosphodiesterase
LEEIILKEQKDVIIKLYEIKNNSYRQIAQEVNKVFGIDYWDSERVRDTIRQHRKTQIEDIKVPNMKKDFNFNVNKKKILVFADWHFPFHREDLLSVIEKHKNEICAIFVGGDAINNDALSRFSEIGKKSFEVEIINFYLFIKEIVDIIGDKIKIFFIRGNHELRLYKYVANLQQKELAKFINPEVIAMLTKGFTIYENNKDIYYSAIPNVVYIPHWFCNINNELIIAHPEENSKTIMRTGIQAVDYFISRNEKFSTVAVFHTHKFGQDIKFGKWGIQIGCMCLPQKYADKGSFGYSPQDYGYAIFQFDENGKVVKNESRIYQLDEISNIAKDIDYNVII